MITKNIADMTDDEFDSLDESEPIESLFESGLPIYPKTGDYVQLLDSKGKPSENHTSVNLFLGELGMGLYLIRDDDGESFAVTRCENLDNQLRNGWREVITAIG